MITTRVDGYGCFYTLRSWFVILKANHEKTHHVPVPEANAVVAGSDVRQYRHRKLYVGLALLIVVLIAAAFMLHSRMRHNQLIADDNQTYQSDIKLSFSLRGVHEYLQAIEPLEEYVNNGLNNQQKVYALLNIANIYEDQQNESGALKAYRQAEGLNTETQNSEAIDVGIARTSYALGDKTAALVYYKKCLPLLEKQTGYSRGVDISVINETISQIEATQ